MVYNQAHCLYIKTSLTQDHIESITISRPLQPEPTCISKGVSSPHRGREGMQLQACAVDHQKLYE